MKILLTTLFIFNSYLFSSELFTYEKSNQTYSYCIENYYIKNNRIYFKKSSTKVFYFYEDFFNIKSYEILSGYIYSDNRCKKTDLTSSDYELVSSEELNHKNLSSLGLSNEDLNFMFALSGFMTSFLILFGVARQL